ncbi:MAG: M81 family metallopeptidase [Fimbriimonadaceae bacterium]|nr:M81 family metallopeptidase [Fimbriimonadaceae bacterium]
MRLVTACLAHETNTFATGLTELADFGRQPPGPAFPAGAVIRKNFQGTRTILGGLLDVAAEQAVTVDPLLWVFATPSGVVRQEAYEHLLGLLLQRLAAAGPVDGVLLELHGAMVTTALSDAEGHLAAAVRQVVGPAVPIALTIDLHANVTPAMVAAVDLLVGFDLYPHTDMYERGREAAELLLRTVRGEIRPTMALRQVPLLTMPPKQCTLLDPMRQVLAAVHAAEALPGVLCASLAPGFPFADIPAAGATVVVVTDGDAALAEAQAAALAGELWRRRAEFEVELQPIDAVIRYARRAEGLVILADGSDNPGGGAPCDGTVILEALIEADLPDAVVAVIADPETAQQAHDAGVGTVIHARLGGKTDDLHGPPLEVEAYVKHLGDGLFTYRAAMSAGVAGDLGLVAVLQIGRVSVIVTERRVQVWDPEVLRSVGIEPATCRLLALKSAVHFRAAFAPLAEQIFDADTPGVHRPDFGAYDYQHVRRPIWPLDRDFDYDPLTGRTT